jgi:lysyl-tRNA synthetase class 1
MGVNVEGAGKDHTSAGGSRDMAAAICERVFQIPEPFDIPYEWILIRGTKMSSSKGVGTSAREFVQLFPAEVGRFLFVNKFAGQVIDFDPQTATIPDLFDDYDLGAKIYWGQAKGDDRLARSFEVSQIGEVPTAHFLPRFRDVAIWMQYPEINLETKFAEVKGAPLTDLEKEVLAQRKKHAQIWLKRYAPAEFQIAATNNVVDATAQLTPEQKQFLVEVSKMMDENPQISPEDLQQQIFDLAKKTVSPKQGFAAIYLAFLGKTAGPKAAWFLQSLEPEVRRKRIGQIDYL